MSDHLLRRGDVFRLGGASFRVVKTSDTSATAVPATQREVEIRNRVTGEPVRKFKVTGAAIQVATVIDDELLEVGR